jgi:phage-related protein (TIGR01555 family)
MWPFKSKTKSAVKSMIAPILNPIAKEIKKWVITQELLAILEHKKPSAEIVPYVPPKGVIPEAKRKAALAMDETPYNYVNATYAGVSFKGYPYLALLSQQPEFRKISEDIAQHMVRKWINVESKGDKDKTDRVSEMEQALKDFNVRDLFKYAAEMDGFYGRGQIYIEVKTPSGVLASDDEEELKLPLILDKAKIKKGSLVRLKLVEPVWTYPNQYNSSNPLDKDWYKPSRWYVMGKDVHDTRLLLFISRPLPDLLKASYNFGGLSLSQLAEQYVNNFLRTRDSVSDIIHSYSVSGIKTDLEALLQPGMAQEMENRARLYNAMRDNRGLFIMDKDREEFFQFNTPLNGLDKLQAQSQEMMATVAKEPLIYMFGTTPSGLNATSEGEIKVWHEYVTAMQDVLFRANLEKVFQVIGLNLWGEIDDDITFDFVSLDEMTPKEKADIEKVKADTDAVNINNGVIAPDEARQRIANDPESDYQGLEVNREITGPDDEDDGEETAKDYAMLPRSRAVEIEEALKQVHGWKEP